jgi:hypothetical protein
MGGKGMARILTDRALHLAAIAVVVVASMAVGAASARAEVDLSGTWHVLVHYKDEMSANPDEPRWDDRLWSFELTGSRLRWMEWPIVVFSNETGRFERRGTGQYARILHYWEPNQSQLDNIRDGLAVNDRGSKSKTLRKEGDGWRSTGGARARSAMTITYQENWIVENASELPVFIREEMLGAASTESLEGRTEYRTQEIREGGDVLAGSYERDGTRHGSFRMTRAGARKQLEEKSQKERQEEAWRRGAMSSQMVREEVRKGIEKALEARGVSVEDDRLDELVDEWLRLYESGLREGEIGAQLIEQVLREAGDAP